MTARQFVVAGVALLGLLVWLRCPCGEVAIDPGSEDRDRSTSAPKSPEVTPPVRTRATPAEAVEATRALRARVRVSDASGKPVVAATVSLFPSTGDARGPIEAGSTGSDGVFAFAWVPEGVVGVRVSAPDLCPWVGEFRFGPGAETLSVSLQAGLEISGSVTAEGRPVSGAGIRVIARAGAVWAFPDFVTSSAWPSVGAACAAPGAAVHQWHATSDRDGAFVVRGFEPGWRCAVIVDDEHWIGAPVATAASPGDRYVELRVRPATIAEVVVASGAVEAGRGPVEVLMTARAANGGVASFAFEMRDARSFVRFAAPPEWSGAVIYDAIARGDGYALACHEKAGRVGDRTRVELMADSLVGPAWTLTLNATWADGSPCDSGIMVRAFRSTGEGVECQAYPAAPSGYRVTASAAPARVEWLPRDTFRELHAAVKLPADQVPSGSVVTSAMPPGPDLELVLPGMASGVLLLGPEGARSLRVDGVLRLRSVAPGRYSAEATVAGTPMTRGVVTGASGLHRLDFSQ